MFNSFKKKIYRSPSPIDKVVIADGTLKEIREYTHTDGVERTRFIIDKGLFSNYKQNGTVSFGPDTPCRTECWTNIRAKIPLEYIGRKVDYITNMYYMHDGLSVIVNEELRITDNSVSPNVIRTLSATYIESALEK